MSPLARFGRALRAAFSPAEFGPRRPAREVEMEANKRARRQEEGRA